MRLFKSILKVLGINEVDIVGELLPWKHYSSKKRMLFGFFLMLILLAVIIRIGWAFLS
jgi:hypothetical protein